MIEALRGWWNRLRVQQKLSIILFACFLPILSALAVHVTIVDRLLSLHGERHRSLLAREQLHILRRMAVDIEDAFRGYLLTGQDAFLTPLEDAEAHLEPALDQSAKLIGGIADLSTDDVRRVDRQLRQLVESKQALIRRIRNGHLAEVLEYVRSGQGLRLSDQLRQDLRTLEDRLDQRLDRLEQSEGGIAQYAFRGLLVALLGGTALGFAGVRLLAGSITKPLAFLQSSVETFGETEEADAPLPSIDIHSSDEIGNLARAYEGMARRIRNHIGDLEAISAIGHEINIIGPDGLEGCLRRIADRAVELTQADVCLVMLRDDKMGCWVVEAASGEWGRRLNKSVMLWEEFPVSVRAFETREPAFGEHLRRDRSPEVSRRNLIGDSMLSIPLLSQGEPFGVLVLLKEDGGSRDRWNVRLAKGLAEEAALAISNARLYEQAHQKQKDLAARLRHLEHLAETLAHDLKGPGERMGGLASLVMKEYQARLDDRGARWLSLIEQNGRELAARVEGLLAVARVGSRQEAIAAVDPYLVINEVLKARSWQLEQRRAQVEVGQGFPLVACHHAYLRQVFDNLISNSVRFTPEDVSPDIAITAARDGPMACFAIRDRGVGIPADKRKRVFEPFVRLQLGGDKGSGIGLTIVKRIVELYGGQVWIEPNEGPGCTVKFTLPVLGEFDSVAPGSMESAEERRRPDG
ncbi:MAG: hypothetical protein KatS3mg082_1282 [Nitrospiraceae bacterium]|nr:MAG: hypothetical protein KatS3mg082_1282 [Nitrospiraceae bacterium]